MRSVRTVRFEQPKLVFKARKGEIPVQLTVFMVLVMLHSAFGQVKATKFDLLIKFNIAGSLFRDPDCDPRRDLIRLQSWRAFADGFANKPCVLGRWRGGSSSPAREAPLKVLQPKDFRRISGGDKAGLTVRFGIGRLRMILK